jgi:hypothetical protein
MVPYTVFSQGSDLLPIIRDILAIIGIVVVAVISGWFLLRSKQREYEHHYFNTILDRRIRVYEELEKIITLLKFEATREDGRRFAIAFSRHDTLKKLTEHLDEVKERSLWVDKGALDLIKTLDRIRWGGLPNNPDDLLEYSKKHLWEIRRLHADLERAVAEDMLSLHKVEDFLKRKKKAIPHVPVDADQ